MINIFQQLNDLCSKLGNENYIKSRLSEGWLHEVSIFALSETYLDQRGKRENLIKCNNGMVTTQQTGTDRWFQEKIKIKSIISTEEY